VADDHESKESKPLEEVIDDFVSINDELERLSGLASDLLATSEQLDAARKNVEKAASEASASYQTAIAESDQRIKKAISDTKKSLIEFFEELRQQSDSQHADSREILNTLRSTAETALESAERDHRNTASALQSLITLMKDAGRDLADTAASFRSLDPEAMQKQVDAIRAEAMLIKKEGRVAIASVVLTLIVLLVVLL
jgi:uncharacterized protein YecA (UPF0149 family)